MKSPGGCFNKHDRLSDWATDNSAVDKINNMGGWFVARSDGASCLLRLSPGVILLSTLLEAGNMRVNNYVPMLADV